MNPDDEDNPFGPGPPESPGWVKPWGPCPSCGSNKNVVPDCGSADFGFDGTMFCFSCEIEYEDGRPKNNQKSL